MNKRSSGRGNFRTDLNQAADAHLGGARFDGVIRCYVETIEETSHRAILAGAEQEPLSIVNRLS